MEHDFDEKQLTVSPKARASLLSMSKWAKFIAILMFIYSGLMVAIGLAMFVLYQFAPAAIFLTEGLAYFYLLLALIGVAYFFPAYFLYQFTSKAQKAVYSTDSDALAESFGFHRNYYKFLGIMVIAVIGLYLLAVPLLMIPYFTMMR